MHDALSFLFFQKLKCNNWKWLEKEMFKQWKECNFKQKDFTTI